MVGTRWARSRLLPSAARPHADDHAIVAVSGTPSRGISGGPTCGTARAPRASNDCCVRVIAVGRPAHEDDGLPAPSRVTLQPLAVLPAGHHAPAASGALLGEHRRRPICGRAPLAPAPRSVDPCAPRTTYCEALGPPLPERAPRPPAAPPPPAATASVSVRVVLQHLAARGRRPAAGNATAVAEVFTSITAPSFSPPPELRARPGSPASPRRARRSTRSPGGAASARVPSRASTASWSASRAGTHISSTVVGLQHRSGRGRRGTPPTGPGRGRASTARRPARTRRRGNSGSASQPVGVRVDEVAPRVRRRAPQRRPVEPQRGRASGRAAPPPRCRRAAAPPPGRAGRTPRLE